MSQEHSLTGPFIKLFTNIFPKPMSLGHPFTLDLKSFFLHSPMPSKPRPNPKQLTDPMPIATHKPKLVWERERERERERALYACKKCSSFKFFPS